MVRLLLTLLTRSALVIAMHRWDMAAWQRYDFHPWGLGLSYVVVIARVCAIKSDADRHH